LFYKEDVNNNIIDISVVSDQEKSEEEDQGDDSNRGFQWETTNIDY
tara:strand:+ start:286 stop:423 length:138 start_codon:yes stop_codon:yes gene_type:complete